LMTLYLTPVVYTYMSSILERWRGLRRRHGVMGAEPAMQSGD
jgi:hypothetical protein